MPDQSVMATPIFDELVAELGHELSHLASEPETDAPKDETDAA
jgi:hypothetical protein